MKIAIVHYWLVKMRGGEAVLSSLCEMFPDADVYTHVYDESVFKDSNISNHKVNTTFINSLPLSKKVYKLYLPLMPIALEQLDFRGYDLVISSESGPSKGIITSPDCVHVCYCHSPMRYAWDMYHEYIENKNKLFRFVASMILFKVRVWDALSSLRVDKFIASSNAIKRRICKIYRRDSIVIHPPVDVSSFYFESKKDEFYIYVGELVDYKRVDVAIDACNALNKELVIIGEGPAKKKLMNRAGKSIKFLGYQSGDVVRRYLSKGKAFLFPGREDFGIAPVEALASGTPVLAFGKGGALDYCIDGDNSILFYEQNSSSLVEAIQRFEKDSVKMDAKAISDSASKFSKESFKNNLLSYINTLSFSKGDFEKIS